MTWQIDDEVLRLVSSVEAGVDLDFVAVTFGIDELQALEALSRLVARGALKSGMVEGSGGEFLCFTEART